MTIRLFGCLTKVCCGPCPDTYTIEAWEICGAAGSPCASYGLWMPKPSTGAAAGANKATITYANCAGGGSVALPIRTYHVIPAYGCESSPHEGAWLGGAWSSCDTCSMANPLPGTLVHVASVAFSYDPALAGGTDPERLLAVYTYNESGGDAPGTTEVPHPACPAGGALGFAGITNNIAVMGSTPTVSNERWPCSIQCHRYQMCQAGATTIFIALDPGSQSAIEEAAGPITGMVVTWSGGSASGSASHLALGSVCHIIQVWTAMAPATATIIGMTIQTPSGLRHYQITTSCFGLRASIIDGGSAIIVSYPTEAVSGTTRIALGGANYSTSKGYWSNYIPCKNWSMPTTVVSAEFATTKAINGWQMRGFDVEIPFSMTASDSSGTNFTCRGRIQLHKECGWDFLNGYPGRMKRTIIVDEICTLAPTNLPPWPGPSPVNRPAENSGPILVGSLPLECTAWTIRIYAEMSVLSSFQYYTTPYWDHHWECFGSGSVNFYLVLA